MEPVTIFAVSIGLVGVCRLAFVTADFIGKGIYSRGSKPANRVSWYCYFKTSDLWGVTKQQKTAHPETPLQQRQRPRHSYQRTRPKPERSFH